MKNNKKEIQDELEELAPLLSKLKKEEGFSFPDDYFKITSKYLENLVKGTEDQVYSLIRNCIHSGASINSLILEVILPAIDSVNELYDDGKIGTSELNLLRTTISKSLQSLTNFR